MELRHLRYFVAAAEELSITRAATRLHLAQPALSVQIRHLEQELGVELFDRSRRAITLTNAGEAMLSEARWLLASLDRSLDLVRRVGAGAIGSLAVGFVPSAANSTLPLLLRRFSDGRPEVAIRLREMTPDGLVEALHRGSLDVVFLHLPLDDPLLDHIVIMREPFVVALPADHPLGAGEIVDIRALQDEAFVTPAKHRIPGLYAQVIGICGAAGFAPRAVQDDVWLVQTMVALVAAGVGVALVPESSRAGERAGVVYRTLQTQSPHEVELAGVWRRGARSAVLDAFVGLLGSERPSRVSRSAPPGKR
jgi:DNA-binding transcriptional LysR family regulator